MAGGVPGKVIDRILKGLAYLRWAETPVPRLGHQTGQDDFQWVGGIGRVLVAELSTGRQTENEKPRRQGGVIDVAPRCRELGGGC